MIVAFLACDRLRRVQEFPVDWLSDSSNIFSQTLKLASLLGNSGSDCQELADVMQGRKEVRVPPGR